jgi:uncharacterized protein
MSAQFKHFSFELVEFDEVKRSKNIKEHHVDFLEAALIFEGQVITKIDDRMDYGEIRHISIGVVDGHHFVVVHTQRGTSLRIISAWRAGTRDRAKYQKAITQ